MPRPAPASRPFHRHRQPYEAPEHPELWIDTTAISAEAAAEQVVDRLIEFEKR